MSTNPNSKRYLTGFILNKLKKNDFIYFDMPPICTGSYSAKVKEDEKGLYIDKKDDYFVTCVDWRVNQPFWRDEYLTKEELENKNKHTSLVDKMKGEQILNNLSMASGLPIDQIKKALDEREGFNLHGKAETANQGLTIDNPDEIKLGGTILHDTTIDPELFKSPLVQAIASKPRTPSPMLSMAEEAKVIKEGQIVKRDFKSRQVWVIKLMAVPIPNNDFPETEPIEITEDMIILPETRGTLKEFYDKEPDFIDELKTLKEIPFEKVGEDKNRSPLYFTPLLEDICVGYEAEANLKLFGIKDAGWEPFVFEGVGQEVIEYHKKGMYRVPYLTKEQIEKEGWKYHSNSEAWECPIFRKGNWMLFFNKTEIWIQLGNQMKWDGEIKDINTFRYICQLLKIQ